MTIIIFCYYTKQKERQGKNGREATIVIAFWLFWLLCRQEPTTCAKFSAAHYQDLLVRREATTRFQHVLYMTGSDVNDALYMMDTLVVVGSE
jgi:hypothetical protein